MKPYTSSSWGSFVYDCHKTFGREKRFSDKIGFTRYMLERLSTGGHNLSRKEARRQRMAAEARLANLIAEQLLK